MREAAPEQLFRQYWAAKQTMAAYGPSEFENELSFTAAPSDFACSDVAKIINRFDVDTETTAQAYGHAFPVPAGLGKTHIVVEYTLKLVGILPATDVTAGETVTISAVGHGGSMATQEPAPAEQDSIGRIISQAATSLPVRYREKLALRLRELEEAVQEEPDGRGIVVLSLHHFVEFLRTNPLLRCPAVSVSPDGNIYASWKSAPERVFSIHFLPDGKVRFVIFTPNDKHPGEVIRLSGLATADVVMSTTAPHGVLDWASDGSSGNPRL